MNLFHLNTMFWFLNAKVQRNSELTKSLYLFNTFLTLNRPHNVWRV